LAGREELNEKDNDWFGEKREIFYYIEHLQQFGKSHLPNLVI
jgi:hypothetical protein